MADAIIENQMAARARARDDFANMPAFTGEVTHQAMLAETVTP